MAYYRQLLNLVLWIPLSLVSAIALAQSKPVQLGTIVVQQLPQSSSGPPYDAGQISLTINGLTKTVAYGRYTSPAAIASGFGAAFSQACSSTVYAWASGVNIVLYQKGSSSGLSLSSSVQYDSQDFPHASFALALPAQMASSQTSLAVTPLSATVNSTVTLTANVTPATATGTVSFYDGTTLLSPVQVTSGTATWTTTALSVGNHTLTAAYGGDGADSASLSPGVTIAITSAGSSPGLLISSISPNSGRPGDSPISIHGSGFTNTQGQLLYNGAFVPVLSWSDTLITFSVPANAISGSLAVLVNGSQSNRVPFTINSTFQGCPVL